MSQQQRTGKRVSLACTQCRVKHIRCDAIKPTCGRCQQEQQDCYYPSSKRGGLTKASLAQARARKTAIERKNGLQGAAVTLDAPDPASRSTHSSDSTSSPYGSSASIPTALHTNVDFESADESMDMFIKMYYKCFHRYHPCVLPAARLHQYFDNPIFHDQLLPVMSAIRFIGSLYARSPFSETLLKETDSDIAKARQDSLQSPFVVQALLLYSVALYWSEDDGKAREAMDLALETALQLGMNRSSFATDVAPNDTLLQECFRRTWWQIYIIDAAYAAIERSPTFTAQGVVSEVNLPCSEDDYERGVRSLIDPLNRPVANC